MKKEARVLIVDDDPFARDWMALLLARDWRTRSVGEVSSLAAAVDFCQSPAERPNCVLVNTDLLNAGLLNAGLLNTGLLNTGLPGPAPAAALSALPGAPLVLLTGKAAAGVPLPFPGFGGYLLKPEIGDALGWAVALADTSQWVITPGVMETLRAARLPAPSTASVLVLDGRKSIHNLTEHEAKVARMALIFSMERRELSDELKISPDWSYGLVSSIYQKLGMSEILSGEIDAVEFLGQQFAENPRFQETLKTVGKSRHNDLESLAFHILTMPEITEME